MVTHDLALCLSHLSPHTFRWPCFLDISFIPQAYFLHRPSSHAIPSAWTILRSNNFLLPYSSDASWRGSPATPTMSGTAAISPQHMAALCCIFCSFQPPVISHPGHCIIHWHCARPHHPPQPLWRQGLVLSAAPYQITVSTRKIRVYYSIAKNIRCLWKHQYYLILEVFCKLQGFFLYWLYFDIFLICLNVWVLWSCPFMCDLQKLFLLSVLRDHIWTKSCRCCFQACGSINYIYEL